MKTTDFITENKFIADDAHAMHQDHEIQMARSDCYNAAKYAIELHKLLKNISEMEGLDGWVSEKITLANDYLRTVAEYLRHEQLEKQSQMPEIFTAESAEAKFAALLNEFAPSVGGGDDGDDGFDEDTLRQLAARWYQGDEDPRVEQVLMAAGWEIGQDEGYEDEPGVFVVMSGDEHGKSYISWPASELQSDVAEQGVAESSMYGDEEVSWEKGGRRAPTGAFRNPAADKKDQKAQARQQSKAAFSDMMGRSAADLTSRLKIREQGMAEGSFGSGYGNVFTLYVNTGEKPATKTKTKKFKREDDAVLWAEDYADQHDMLPNLKMEIQDENGNVVWELEEPQGVAEGLYKDTSGTFMDRVVGEIMNYRSLNNANPKFADLSSAVKSKLKSLGEIKAKQIYQQALKQAAELSGQQGVAEGAFQDDGKMDWDAWKQKAKKHGAVKFTDTDNKTIAYDKDGKVVSSITWSQKKSGMAEATGYTGTGMHPKVVEVLKQRGFKGPYQLGKLKKWQASLNDIGANPTDEIMVTGNDVDYDEWVVAITPNHYVYGAETGYNTGSAARVIKDTTPVTEQGVAEGPDTGIGSKLPKSDIETFGLQKGRPYKINPPEDFKPGDRKRAVQQLIPTQDKKDHIRSRLGKHVAPALPEQGVAEDRTEVKDKEGRVQSWRDESDWKRSEKKDPRGKVTNMSDKARRETEKLSVKETTSTGGIATVPGVGGGPKVGSLFGGSYAPRTPFAGKKKAKESVIKR